MSGKRILVGITGGIAAYKTCELIRLYKNSGAQVRVVLTENSLQFVTRLTLQTLSQNPVYLSQFETENFQVEHIELCGWADAMVIAPMSANTIGKVANGICDNLLTSVVCAFKKPIIIAPSMNCGMWDNCFVQENIKKLAAAGFSIVEPEVGYLACGDEGKGRLAKLEQIFGKTKEALNA